MRRLTYEDDSLSILVVDDEENILLVLENILRADGHRVRTAPNGLAALEIFRAQPCDVVLTDRAMPGMDGERLAREIKKSSPVTPVIMITGFAPPACCDGVDEVVRKPFSRAALVGAISKCLASTEPRDHWPAAA